MEKLRDQVFILDKIDFPNPNMRLEGRRQEKIEDGGHRSGVSFVLCSGLLIFLFGVVLEVVQFYLPCRTFNVYDVVGNLVGILSFVFIWAMIYGRMQRGNLKRMSSFGTARLNFPEGSPYSTG